MNTSSLKPYKNTNTPSRSKSQTKISTSPRKALGSPTSSQKKITRPNEATITSKMKLMRQKLCSALDAHILILETHAPMRCLQHNSVLSLYCETQQKLLCANCVYRSNGHKLHRVFPLQKCYKQISRDVEQMSRQVDRQIAWAETTTKSILDFFKEEEKNANDALLNLDQLYSDLQFQLARSFQQCKKRIITTMDSIFVKKQSLLLELEFFKDIFTKNKPMNFQKQSQSDLELTQYHLVFNHMIGNSLIEFGKIEGSRINEGGSKIKNLQKQEMLKLSEFKSLIDSWRAYQSEKPPQKTQP